MRATETEDLVLPIMTPTRNHDTTQPAHKGRNRGATIANPLQKGIRDFLAEHLTPAVLSEYHGLAHDDGRIKLLPKRYTIYPPLLLLPPNTFSFTAEWARLYDGLTDCQREALYASIQRAFSGTGVTHIAVNAPIAATHGDGRENRSRSPTGLVPLFGDFGPEPVDSGGDEEGKGKEDNLTQPSATDCQRAFWVTAVQNSGIFQTWAPRYTMFSRGNITEKARILGTSGTTFEGLDEGSLQGARPADIGVVDLYAGIGYFVFSYLQRGVARVWGFEINGWSVEGLRRGCVRNGWGCRVVRLQRDGRLEMSVSDLVASLTDLDRAVIFHGDNAFAPTVLAQIREQTLLLQLQRQRAWCPIRHVNLGLLPSSKAAWSAACSLVDREQGGWLHVHENIDVEHVEHKKDEVTAEIRRLWSETCCGSTSPSALAAVCRHVELVKSYAPGVVHCVFDVALPACEQRLHRG